MAARKKNDMDLAHLTRVIEQQSFRPLFATVSGAHLYGFESPDSDFDLRGAFVLPLDVVLGLNLSPPEETVTVDFFDQGKEIDLVVHDILKFCRLLTRKNGYVLEQLYSPLVVWGGPLLDELRVIARGCVVKHVYHHYRGFLKNQMNLASQPEGPVKEILYGYRVALTGIHLLRSGEIQAHLPTLLQLLPQGGVDGLIERKRAGQEKALLSADLRGYHLAELRRLEGQLQEEFDNSHLPDELSNLSQLNDFVVRVRKG